MLPFRGGRRINIRILVHGKESRFATGDRCPSILGIKGFYAIGQHYFKSDQLNQ